MAHPFSKDTLKHAALEEGCSKKGGKEDDQIQKNNLPAVHQASISLLWYSNILKFEDQKIPTI